MPPKPLPLIPFAFASSRLSSQRESVSFIDTAVGVGHEEQPVPDVRCANAVCAQYRRRNGVAFRFQVCRNKVEPAVSNRRINLFSKDDWRAALADEPKPFRPEVTRVVKPLAFASRREGWTRAASGPHWSAVGPSCVAECETPETRACKEMTLGVLSEFPRSNIDN
jgi:hypothetical protein